MSHVSNPQIEHYRPKSREEFSALIFAWENWLLSCGKCNEKKWAHFPICGRAPCLIDPTAENPASEVTFVDSHILGTTQRGRETIRLLKLDRSPLEDQRETWLAAIRALLLLMLNVSEKTRQDIRALLIWAMQGDAPYSGMTVRYLETVAPKLANPEMPHPPVQLSEPRERMRRLIAEHAEQLKQLV
jgi:hypothetical protein